LGLLAEALTDLCQVFVCELIIAEVKLIDHRVVLDSRQNEVETLTVYKAAKVEFKRGMGAELSDHFANLLCQLCVLALALRQLLIQSSFVV